MGKCWF